MNTFTNEETGKRLVCDFDSDDWRYPYERLLACALEIVEYATIETIRTTSIYRLARAYDVPLTAARSRNVVNAIADVFSYADSEPLEWVHASIHAINRVVNK